MRQRAGFSTQSLVSCSGRDGAELPTYTLLVDDAELTDLPKSALPFVDERIPADEDVQAPPTDTFATSIARDVSPVDHMHCDLDKDRLAVWQLSRGRQQLLLSAFAANVLCKARMIKPDDLILFRTNLYEHDHSPLDPFSGLVVATVTLFHEVFKSFGEVAIECDTIATAIDEIGRKRRGPSTSRRERLGARATRGTVRLFSATLRSPMNVTMALADGAHYMPRLWHDDTLRPRTEITGVGSGIVIGCKELVLGTYDSIAGLIVQPYLGARQGGVVGGCQGIAKGLASFPVKLLAAAAGPAAYPLKGLDVHAQRVMLRNRAMDAEVHKIILNRRDIVSVTNVIEQGEYEYRTATEAQRMMVLERWTAIQEKGKIQSK